MVLYTDLLFQLPPTLTIKGSQFRAIGYEVCGYAAKDHYKINEGEGKEIYGSIVKRPKTPAFHVGDTGSNPVGATICPDSSVVQFFWTKVKIFTHLIFIYLWKNKLN